MKTNVSYVEQNDSFNTEISKLVSKLSGYSIDTKIDGVDITKTPRARVDAVLASTLPTLWLFQSTDTTELDTIITELTKIKTDVVGTADEAIVGDIITAYTKLKVDVSTAESIRNFMDKSETITAPFPGTQSL